MYVKRHIKQLRLSILIPLVVLWMVLPELVIIMLREEDVLKPDKIEILWQTIVGLNNTIIPIFSVIWPMLLLNNHIEARGNEVLYITDRNKYVMVLGSYIVYMLHVYVSYLTINAMTFITMLEFVRMAIICFLFNAIFYTLAYIVSSTGLAFTAIVLYNILSMFYLKGKSIGAYVYESHMTTKVLTDRYIEIFALAIVFFAFGVILNKKYERYR